MAVTLPLLTFALAVAAFRMAGVAPCWRSSFVAAALAWGMLVTAFTEILSVPTWLSFGPVAGLWLASALVAAVCLGVVLKGRRNAEPLGSQERLGWFEVTLLAGAAAVVATVGLTALVSPPNTWDSMTYHMSRVAHWIQDASVRHYPTHILRQLFQAPWSEYAILHLQILSGADRFASLVQWFSMIGCAVGASLVARQLGADTRGQVYSAVLSVTIPMGILQASSTQNDYVVSFWLVCLAWVTLSLGKGNGIVRSLAAGSGLGLAILTKGTAFIFALPFTVWALLRLAASRRRRWWGLAALVVGVAALTNLGQWARNYRLSGSPLGPGSEGASSFAYLNAAFTPSTVVSNALRNIGLHLGTARGVDPIPEGIIVGLLEMLGIDPNDPRTTWTGTEFQVVPLSLHEGDAGNLLHLVLIFVSVPLVVAFRRENAGAVRYLACLVAGFLLFVTLFRWQPWNSRLQLPLFVLWSPLIGTLLSRVRYRRVAGAAVAIAVAGAVPWLLFNWARPLLGPKSIFGSSRTDLYFRNRPEAEQPYLRAATLLAARPCSDVGLLLGGDDWEYPLWVLFGEDRARRVHLQHVNVENVSGVLSSRAPFSAFTPCAAISVTDAPPGELLIGGAVFPRVWASDRVGVYLRNGSARQPSR